MNYPKDFEEKATYGMVVKALLAGSFILLAALLVLSQSIIPQQLSFAKTLTLLALLLAVMALWMFFDMKFGADSQSVFVKTGPFVYRIRKSGIRQTNVLERIPFWAGWGIRVWWWNGFTLAFVSQHKPSLYFVKKTGLFKKVVFSVSDPRAFAKKAGLRISSE